MSSEVHSWLSHCKTMSCVYKVPTVVQYTCIHRLHNIYVNVNVSTNLHMHTHVSREVCSTASNVKGFFVAIL